MTIDDEPYYLERDSKAYIMNHGNFWYWIEIEGDETYFAQFVFPGVLNILNEHGEVIWKATIH